MPWLGSQSRGVFWFPFIALAMVGIYVVPASKDLGKWDRLCLINHPNIPDGREGATERWEKCGRGFRSASQFTGLESLLTLSFLLLLNLSVIVNCLLICFIF